MASDMNDTAIRFLGDMTKLTVGPDDLYVIQCDTILTNEQFERITERVSSIFGKGKVVVLDKGMRLGVMGKDGAPPPPPERTTIKNAGTSMLDGLSALTSGFAGMFGSRGLR